MYIGITNMFLNVPECKTSTPTNWIASEQYYNCDNFSYYMNNVQKKKKFFHKRNKK